MKLHEIIQSALGHKVELAVAEMVLLFGFNLLVHNINDILHVITGLLSAGYIGWKWYREYKKSKANEHNHKGS